MNHLKITSKSLKVCLNYSKLFLDNAFWHFFLENITIFFQKRLYKFFYNIYITMNCLRHQNSKNENIFTKNAW